MHQVATYLNVNRKLVVKWIESGTLPAIKLPGAKGEWRFSRKELHAFIQSRRYRAGA